LKFLESPKVQQFRETAKPIQQEATKTPSLKRPNFSKYSGKTIVCNMTGRPGINKKNQPLPRAGFFSNEI